MVIDMKHSARFSALAAVLLFAALSFGGCFKIRPIQKPEDSLPVDPVPAAPAETEPPETEPAETVPPEEITVDEDVLASAVALGIAGNGEHYIEEADGLWNVIGWYAALNARVSDADAEPWLSDGTCGALTAILFPDADPIPIPDYAAGISMFLERLTDAEQRRGLEPQWLPLQDAVELFSRHQDYAAESEEKRGAYLREYTALQEYLRLG